MTVFDTFWPNLHNTQNSLPCLFLFFPLSCDPKLCPNNFLSLPLNLLILMSLICSAEHYTTFCPIILTTYLTLSDKGNGGSDIPASWQLKDYDCHISLGLIHIYFHTKVYKWFTVIIELVKSIFIQFALVKFSSDKTNDWLSLTLNLSQTPFLF